MNSTSDEQHSSKGAKGEILVYQDTQGETKMDVRLQNETVWLTINQMSELFGVDKSGISRHLKNIFETGELSKEATVAKYATVQNEGGRGGTLRKYSGQAISKKTSNRLCRSDHSGRPLLARREQLAVLVIIYSACTMVPVFSLVLKTTKSFIRV